MNGGGVDLNLRTSDLQSDVFDHSTIPPIMNVYFAIL